MAGVGSFFGKFFGRTIGDAASFAIGGAVSRTIDPELQVVANESWRAAVAAGATVPLDFGDAAEVVAEDVELQAWGADQAAQGGLGADQFAALVRATLNAPGIGELLSILRRHPDQTALFDHGLRKSRLETIWDGYVTDLANVKLSPQQIALGIVRSVITDPGLLVKQLDTSGSNVPQYEPLDIDAITEAQASGIDRERLRGMVGEIGLPMAAVAAAQAFFRGILTKGAYYQAILEGDTRPEWADTILDYARQISTAHDAVENHLRGYSDLATMYDRAARHGMSQDDATILFQNAGRPLVPHQIRTGLARGAQFHPEPGELTDPYEASAHEANVKPAYYDLYIANKDSFPPLFQLNALVKAGAATPEQAADWSNKNGIAQEVIDALTVYWQGVYPGPGGATAAAKVDPAVTAARAAAVTEIRKAYTAGAISELSARQDLADLGVPAGAIDRVILDWNVIVTVGQQEADTAGGTPH